MPNVLDYLDYRAFLRDFVEEKKRLNRFLSYRSLGGRIGMDAGNLVKVLQDKRHISRRVAANLAKYARLSKAETVYFNTLVAFGKAKKDKDNRELFEKLVSLRSVEARTVQPHRYELYQHWYHTAILALLYISPFDGDYGRLGSRLEPPLTAREARESVQLLVRLGFLKQKPDGGFVHADALLSTGEKWHSLAVRAFQEQTAELGLRALRTQPAGERDISTLTITASAEDLEEIRRVTREYRKSILEIANASEDGDRVYQVNIQVYPLSKAPENRT